MDQLRQQRKVLYAAMKVSHAFLVRAHHICEYFEEKYNHNKAAYEKCDYELSLLDGRWQKVHAATADAKTKKRVRSDDVDPVTAFLNEARECGLSPEDYLKVRLGRM